MPEKIAIQTKLIVIAFDRERGEQIRHPQRRFALEAERLDAGVNGWLLYLLLGKGISLV